MKKEQEYRLTNEEASLLLMLTFVVDTLKFKEGETVGLLIRRAVDSMPIDYRELQRKLIRGNSEVDRKKEDIALDFVSMFTKQELG